MAALQVFIVKYFFQGARKGEFFILFPVFIRVFSSSLWGMDAWEIICVAVLMWVFCCRRLRVKSHFLFSLLRIGELRRISLRISSSAHDFRDLKLRGTIQDFLSDDDARLDFKWAIRAPWRFDVMCITTL